MTNTAILIHYLEAGSQPYRKLDPRVNHHSNQITGKKWLKEVVFLNLRPRINPGELGGESDNGEHFRMEEEGWVGAKTRARFEEPVSAKPYIELPVNRDVRQREADVNQTRPVRAVSRKP